MTPKPGRSIKKQQIWGVLRYVESPEKVDYQLFSPFIANEAKQKYKKQAIIFFKGQIISEFYQRLNTHLPQNVWFLTEMPYFGVL